MKMKQFLLSALCAGLLTMTACQKKAEQQVETTYTATTPLVDSIDLPKDYAANINSLRNVEIRSQQKGLLQTVYVSEGQYVKAGQPLFRIAAVGVDEEIAKAKAEAEQTRIDLENVSKLADNKVVSVNAKRMATAKLRSAEADYRLAVKRKRLSLIKAPFSGILGRIPLKVGSLVDDGDLLTSLSDNRKVMVYFNISETDYLDYRLHPERYSQSGLQLVLANGDVFGAQGRIVDLGGQFDASTGTIAMRAEFANPNNLLRNGEMGTVRLMVKKRNAVMIPQVAVFEEQDRKYVFVVDKQRRVHQRAVTIGAEFSGGYVVNGGLSAGERYLVDGIQKLNDGDLVRFKIVDPHTAMKMNQLSAD